MCGRYASARKRQELVEEFQVGLDGSSEELSADYNVAPTKKVYAVLTRPHEDEKKGKKAEKGADAPEPVRQLRVLRWGLVPSWAKDPSIGSRLINARVETLAEKPSYRRAFAQRRCLLPADGYYEWYKVDKKTKQPFFIHPADGGVMAMAGLYEFWKDPGRADDDPLKWLTTCTVITTTAEDSVGHIHERMPMLIKRESWGDWLDPALTDLDDVRAMLTTAVQTGMESYPVSSDVNSVRNNGPRLIERESPDKALF
ncbi:SOS response-associated peptidase [Sphaerisporangium sp. TRM90804]|uniref:SOS response-associated peptidase n=1 Tax=Sphaerisporangium sp. TRM90804 TaxID=3031113 RepID=UPI00244C45ED|nr:SOS response-associated peptidase [Sphaerisporangium sp. TRM90804]MDH2427797.1 SOS response-associated peptidase [Sphaerisporangium sp. TRM90804]